MLLLLLEKARRQILMRLSSLDRRHYDCVVCGARGEFGIIGEILPEPVLS